MELSLEHSYSILTGAIEPNEPSPEYMLQFDRIICEFMMEQGIPGASLCIYYEGKPMYKQGYGIAGCGQRTLSGSYFRIASISKTITAIGVLKLVENGQLTLDSKVFGADGILDRFHCYHDNQTTITVLHLLQHSAGWDRDLDEDHVFWYNDPTHSDHINVWDNYTLVQYVLKYKLAFEPGTKHAYSNLTYMLLGMIIEKVSGQLYHEYICSMLQPFELDVYVGRSLQYHCNNFKEVSYFNNKLPVVERSVYNKVCEVVPQYGSFPMENSGAYGGLVTCAENLVLLLDSLVMKYEIKHILSDNCVELMLKRPRYSSSEDWYGLGLDVEDFGQSFGHTGAMDGTSSTAHHDKSGFTWALLFNSWAKDMDLDGLVKYALSTVQGYSLWQGMCQKSGEFDYCLMSQDRKQCVSIYIPHRKLVVFADEMRNRGYKIGYISAFVTAFELLFNVIWNKVVGNKAEMWMLVLDLKQKELGDFMDKMNGNKTSIILCDSYVIKDEIYHIFVVSERHGSSLVYCVDVTEHEKKIEAYNKLGYTLIDQSVVAYDSGVYVTALYSKTASKQEEKHVEQDLWTGLPVDDFVNGMHEKTLQQYRLDSVQFYTINQSIRVAAIWTKLRISKSAFQRHIIYQRYNVSKYALLYELKESLRKNQPVKCLCSYVDEGVKYFVCIWGRYNRSKK